MHEDSKKHDTPTDANNVLAEVREQIINYIENEAEIAMPVDELMHESGRHLTKKEYGHVLLKYLVIELREHFR
jgi:hypothetical protein